FFSCYRALPHLHSFPTRRSSDLAALEHLLRLDPPAVAKMIHEQVAHLPAMAHFFRHHAAKRLAVVLARRVLEEAPLLLDRRKLRDRKSTRLNSSHDQISYAVFCL